MNPPPLLNLLTLQVKIHVFLLNEATDMAPCRFSILSMCSRTLHLELSKLFHHVLMQLFHLFTHSTNVYGRPTMLRHSGSRDRMNEIYKALALIEPTNISIKFHQFCFVCDLRISICILMVTPNKFTLSL